MLREFGFGAVVVDVVARQRVVLGGITRLAGAQHDAGGRQAQVAPDVVDQLEPGVGGFHHHVEQHHGDVGAVGQNVARLRRRFGAQQLDRALQRPSQVERKGGAEVHIGVVIDHQHAPRVGGHRGGGCHQRVIGKDQDVVVWWAGQRNGHGLPCGWGGWPRRTRRVYASASDGHLACVVSKKWFHCGAEYIKIEGVPKWARRGYGIRFHVCFAAFGGSVRSS